MSAPQLHVCLLLVLINVFSWKKVKDKITHIWTSVTILQMGNLLKSAVLCSLNKTNTIDVNASLNFNVKIT